MKIEEIEKELHKLREEVTAAKTEIANGIPKAPKSKRRHAPRSDCKMPDSLNAID